jgi:cytosolic iron-sulfur protein assembly protein CIAO1
MMLAGEDDFEFNVSAILSGHSQDVKSIKWHPTKELLFSASYDNTIKCWAYENTADDWLCRFTM